MQYTYLPISPEVKAIRQLNLVSWYSITWETFLQKNHTQNVIDRLFAGPFLKNQNWEYLWINILQFYILAADHLFLPYNINLFLKEVLNWSPCLVVIFYYLTKFQCLIVFTSWDIGLYVYCNCFLTRLWCQTFWN